MQVFHEFVCIVTKTIKMIKLHATHFMATDYKTVSRNVNDYADKLMIL
jgi:hypothetical protein